jgi:hypothetical protein
MYTRARKRIRTFKKKKMKQINPARVKKDKEAANTSASAVASLARGVPFHVVLANVVVATYCFFGVGNVRGLHIFLPRQRRLRNHLCFF